jgi:hypothetical protein
MFPSLLHSVQVKEIREENESTLAKSVADFKLTLTRIKKRNDDRYRIAQNKFEAEFAEADAWNSQVTFGAHSHSGNIQGTFREHSHLVNIQGTFTFREHSGKIQIQGIFTFRELLHSRNNHIQGTFTFRENLGNVHIRGTFRKRFDVSHPGGAENCTGDGD